MKLNIQIQIQILFLFTFISAETLLVPSEYTSIQNGINSSSNGDTVLVAAGFYSENINFNGKAIVVTSYYEFNNDSLVIAATIIDGNENGSVATFDSEESTTSMLKGFTLQNGNGNYEDPDGNGSYYTYGGGVYCKDSDPIIESCIIQNNTGDEGGGGGIFCYNASPTFFGCIITGNSTDDVGGGLYTRNESSPSFEECRFSGNQAEYGGGCYLRHESTPTMDHVTFAENSSNNSGGAIVLKDDANLQAEYLFLRDNEADGLGGGLYVNNADPAISYCVISENTSSSGAGVYVRNNSNITLVNATVAYNDAGLYGDGIYMRDGSAMTVTNSIIWNNVGSQIYFRSEGNEVELNISYACINDGEDGIIDNGNGDVNWGSGNIDSEPYFCNGPGGNYYLRENSPCVDGGENSALMGCFESGCGPVNVGPIWYVDANGDDANDGSDETPFETIQRAVTACVDGDTIRLNPGPYIIGTIDFEDKEIVLESRAYETNNYSLIENTYFAPGMVGGSCLTLNGASGNNATIRGVSIRGGSEPFGGGLVLSNSSPTFEEIIVEENTAEIGGGVYISNSDAVFENCTFRGNGANFGGAIYITDATPTFNNSMIENNIAYWGGGVYSENSEPTIDGSIFRENHGFIEGGGIYQTGGISTIEWTSFELNQGYDYGGGIVAHAATIDINQSTFTGNFSGMGSALSLHSAAVSIENSILWANDGELIYIADGSGLTAFDIGFSDVEGGESMLNNVSNILLNITGTILDTDPEFCEPSIFDFALLESSGCLEASDENGIIGAFDQSCGETVFVDIEKIPSQFNLAQNFPNPFNPTTTIVFSLDSKTDHALRVYNLKGELIRILSSGEKPAGNYQVKWNAMDQNSQKVPAGMYLYRLETPSRYLSGKMLYIK